MGRGGLGRLFFILLLAGCSGGMGTRVVTGSLAAEPVEIHFSHVALHGSVARELMFRNVGEVPLSLDDVRIDGAEPGFAVQRGFDGPAILEPGATATYRVRFAPTREGGSKASVVVGPEGALLAKVGLSGAGVDTAARLGKDALDFGRVELRSSETLALSVSDPSSLPTTVSVALEGANASDFSTKGVTLSPHESSALSIRFSPSVLGSRNARLMVTPCAGCAPRAVQLMGEGVDSALVPIPPRLDFGRVPVDRAETLELALRNETAMNVELLDAHLGAGTDESFTATPLAHPVTLAPGEVWKMPVRYSPGHMGEADGSVSVSVKSVLKPRFSVPVIGVGGAPEVCVSPVAYDFGKVPVGSKTPVKIHVSSCGASDAPPLVVHGFSVLAGSSDAFSTADDGLPVTLEAGQGIDVTAFYAPTRAGEDTGTLLLDTDGFHGQVKIEVRGQAEQLPPCQLAVKPGALDFGTVDPGRGAVLGVSLRNVGTTTCAVKDVRLSDDGGGVFGMPGGEIPGWLLPAGSFFTLQVSFTASKGPGQFTGTLSIHENNDARPEIDVPLTAMVADACLVAAPWYVDFGLSRPDCAPPKRQVQLMDACPAPVTIDGFEIGPGTADGEFTLTAAPGVPLTLGPGEATTLEVAYQAQVLGMNISPLYVHEEDLDAPLLIPLLGESSAHPTRTDDFVQQDGRKVDVLFVVDDTASMIEEQPRLVAAIPAFVQAAQARGVDLHVAVTTTGIAPADSCPGPAHGGQAGRIVPVDGSAQRVLTNATPDLASALQKRVQVGQCTGIEEQGLEAMRRALSSPLVDHADDPLTPLPNDGNQGFLRPEAGLAVVFVSDEDDHSPNDVETYVRFLESVKGADQPHRATIYGITPDGTACATEGGNGTRYLEAAHLTGGTVRSVCEADFSPLLEEVANEVFEPRTAFVLSGTPAAADTIQVTVNGAPVETGWHYDATRNAVVFDSPPASGAKISVEYLEMCGS